MNAMHRQTGWLRRRAGSVLLALLAALALLPWACGPSRPAAGDAEGPRFVALSPALGVMLRDLGHEDRIVARHAYDVVLDESLPVAGELGRLDYEVLIGVHPTHVLVEWGAESQPLPERLVDLSRREGFQIMRFSMLTLADIRATVERLERDLPPTDRGPQEGYWQERMASRWPDRPPGQTPQLAAAGRVLLLAYAESTIGATGPGSWHHQILDAIGGVPAITRGEPWMELSSEDVLRLAPDAIILIQPRGRDVPPPPPIPAREMLDRLGAVGRLDIPAVRTLRIALIDDPLSHTPSTAMVGLTDQMAAILAGWAAQAPPGAPVEPPP